MTSFFFEHPRSNFPSGNKICIYFYLKFKMITENYIQ